MVFFVSSGITCSLSILFSFNSCFCSFLSPFPSPFNSSFHVLFLLPLFFVSISVYIFLSFIFYISFTSLLSPVLSPPSSSPPVLLLLFLLSSYIRHLSPSFFSCFLFSYLVSACSSVFSSSLHAGASISPAPTKHSLCFKKKCLKKV